MFKFLNFFSLLSKFLLILSILVSFSTSYAEQLIIEKVKINGAKRLSDSFILNFLPEYPNTKFNNEVLNRLTKDLYNTGMFNKVNLKIDNYTLIINIEEYPIINEVSFSGNELLENETLREIISINSRDVFNKNDLIDSIQKIKVEYQKIGRYLAEVNVKKIEIGKGRVNLNYEINEGALLVVKNINFIGNKNFSDNELRSRQVRFYEKGGCNARTRQTLHASYGHRVRHRGWFCGSPARLRCAEPPVPDLWFAGRTAGSLPPLVYERHRVRRRAVRLGGDVDEREQQAARRHAPASAPG